MGTARHARLTDALHPAQPHYCPLQTPPYVRLARTRNRGRAKGGGRTRARAAFLRPVLRFRSRFGGNPAVRSDGSALAILSSRAPKRDALFTFRIIPVETDND